jgi:hypothetical protein
LETGDVGAWLLKANPRYFDIEGALAAGERIDSWRLAQSYRVELITEGDRVVLWVTGSRRGICAMGLVTGTPTPSVGGSSFWQDEDEKGKARPYLPISVSPIEKLTESELVRDERFDSAELITARQMGNPSYLTRLQCEAVIDLLDEATLRSVGWAQRE